MPPAPQCKIREYVTCLLHARSDHIVTMKQYTIIYNIMTRRQLKKTGIGSNRGSLVDHRLDETCPKVGRWEQNV